MKNISFTLTNKTRKHPISTDVNVRHEYFNSIRRSQSKSNTKIYCQKRVLVLECPDINKSFVKIKMVITYNTTK